MRAGGPGRTRTWDLPDRKDAQAPRVLAIPGIMDDRETWLDQVSPTFHLNVMLHRASVLQRALRPPAWRLARLATRPAATAAPGHDEKTA